MAGLHFDITGDNSNFMRKLEETRNGVINTSKRIEESGMSIEQMFGRMTKAAAAFGAGFSAQQFASQVMKVRGEFQQLEVAFNTMLGSKEKADTLMSQLVRTAAITPFDLQGVANGAKQLLAYGTAAEDVNGTLVRLGNIAAGLSIPLNDLVWLYGTTMTQGRLFTQDLRQFQGRGIPLADELAKQFGVTKDKVGELVTAGKVGFPEVQKAIEAMTNEGGKFGGLMEAQSKTITGQISNIEDAISTMFNEIGKSNEGVINSALSGVSYLVEHWEDVAIAIESAAIAYGTYKAAVMTTAALQGAEQTLKIDTEIEGLKSLLVVKEESRNADIAAAVASGRLTEAKAMELAALREELATRLAVLKLKEEEAIAEHASALSVFNTAKQASDVANERLEKMDALYQAALAQGDASYEQYAMEQLQTASANANTAATTLNTAEKNLNAASSKRKAASEAVDTMATQANTVANHANTASMNIMKLAGIQLTTMLKAMWATLMANPLLLVAGAVAGLGFALYKIATAETEAEKATRMYNEALDEQQKKQEEYKERIDSLIKAIDNNNKSEGERLQAFEALKAEYPTVLNNLLTEAEYLKDILKYKKLIAEEDNNRAKQSDEEILEEAKRKLEYYQRVRENGTSTTLVDMDGNGWASDNVETAIIKQQKIVNQAIAKVASHDVTSFLGNIKDLRDSDIASVIDGINTSLKALGKSGDDAIAIVTELGGEFSKSQLSTIKSALETEQNARSTEKNTGKGWIEKYKKSYLDAKEELDKFLNSESELSEVEYERKLKELTDKKDEAEKKYKASGGKVTTDKQIQSEAEKLHKQQQKSAEELLSLRRQNQQDEINLMNDGSDKKLKQIELDYQKEIDAIKKLEKELGKEQGGKLTQEQSVEISTRYSNAGDKKDKSVADLTKEQLKAEQQALNDYLKEYGTFQQQKFAIAQEYAEKIKTAQEENGAHSAQVKLLEKQRDVAIQNKETEAIKANIDWVTVFGEFGGMFNDMIKPALEEAKKYIKTDEFKKSDPASQKSLVDAVNQMEKSFGAAGGLNFKKLGQDMQIYHNSLQRLNTAKETEADAVEKLKKAQEDYEKALKSGTDEEKQATQDALDIARQNADIASSNVKTQTDNANQAQQNVTDTATKLKSGMENVTEGLSKLASGGISSAYQGLLQAGSTMKGAIGEITKSLNDVPVVGWIIAVIDVFKDGLSNVIGGLLDTVFNAVSGIIGDVLSGDLFVTIANSLKDGIGNILNAISFGGFNSLLNIGSNAKEVQEAIDRLTDRNEILGKSIDRLTDVMEKEAGSKSISAYKQAYEYQQEQNANTLQIAREQARYSGSHHSWQKYMGWTNEQIQWVRKNVDENFSGTGSLWGLTPEQMKMLLSNADIYEQISGAGKGGYGNRVMEKLEAYADNAEKLEGLTEKINESLMQVSFNGLRDSFLDSLMDMDKDAKSFSEDFSEYMQRALLNFSLGEVVDEDLKKWYDNLAELMKDQNGKLTEKQLEDARTAYDEMVRKAMGLRDELAAATGYDKVSQESTSQSATGKGFQSMSQDTGNELNGRFTAFQISNEEIKNAMLSMLVYVNLISVSVNNNSITLMEIKNLMVTSNGYLEDISGHTKKMLADFGAKLDSINKNIEKAI